jgi:hypothetical protein
MKIAILGSGFAGCTLAGGLADLGHQSSLELRSPVGHRRATVNLLGPTQRSLTRGGTMTMRIRIAARDDAWPGNPGGVRGDIAPTTAAVSRRSTSSCAAEGIPNCALADVPVLVRF